MSVRGRGVGGLRELVQLLDFLRPDGAGSITVRHPLSRTRIDRLDGIGKVGSDRRVAELE